MDDDSDDFQACWNDLKRAERPTPDAKVDWWAKYEELRMATLAYLQTRNHGTRKDVPPDQALVEAKRAGYRLKVVLGLIAPEKVPVDLR